MAAQRALQPRPPDADSKPTISRNPPGATFRASGSPWQGRDPGWSFHRFRPAEKTAPIGASLADGESTAFSTDADLFRATMPLQCHSMRTELVTTLKRKATEIIADLAQDHEPVLITQHGRPAAYLIDVESFEALNQRIVVLEGIARAEQAIDQGRVISHEEAKNRMGRWFN